MLRGLSTIRSVAGDFYDAFCITVHGVYTCVHLYCYTVDDGFMLGMKLMWIVALVNLNITVQSLWNR